jgi:FkbM family methyltransferase
MSPRRPDKNQTLRLLRERGVPVETVIDVGVLHGTPELMAVWPDKRHVLFEPVAEFAPKIAHNYRNLRHELHTMAVGDSSGTIGLRTTSAIAGMDISHSKMTDAVPGADPAIRSVPKIALDDFLPRRALTEPYLLKIDIDGQELSVLKGAAETLRKCSVVIIECQSSQLVQRISAVQAAGFDLFDLAEPCYYDKVFWQCDAVFVRKDLLAGRFKRLTGMVEPGMYESFRAS